VGVFGASLRLVERTPATDQDAPKALACYGACLAKSKLTESELLLLRFVEGRPVSDVTTTFLDWLCHQLAKRGAHVWVLIWDRASWHLSYKVRTWITWHNRTVKREGGVGILACVLPSKSPWLNPIEPKWLHGKRAICEPGGKLTAEVLVDRVHADYGCERTEPIAQETT